MPPAPLKRFIFLTDLHYGYERKGGRIVPLHDEKALAIVLKFVKDFKPHEIICGGDMLDCGAISHHNDRKPGRIEGLRLFSDAQELQAKLLKPLEATKANLTYIEGNHEDWLNQLVEENPGLGGALDLRRLLSLGPRWRLIRQGGLYNLGKLTFLHGDQLSGGEHVAKSAVVQYERSVRFGHFHTYQAYTKTSAVDIKQGRTGICVPCLCGKAPGYGKSRANRWMQGFLYGYSFPDGYFTDEVVCITHNRAVVNGKVYKA